MASPPPVAAVLSPPGRDAALSLAVDADGALADGLAGGGSARAAGVGDVFDDLQRSHHR